MPSRTFYKKAEQVEALEFRNDNDAEMLAFCPVLSVRESDGALMFKVYTEILPGWYVFNDPEGNWYYSNIFLQEYQINP
jgi:hypothetical protein